MILLNSKRKDLTETSENSPILYRWWDESLPLIVLGVKEL